MKRSRDRRYEQHAPVDLDAVRAHEVTARPKYILPVPASARAPSEAILAVESLERGDWRTAHELAEQLGRPGLAVRQLALSMRERALGMVTESWQALAAAAACCPPERRSSPRPTWPGDRVPLCWPSQAENEFWRRLVLVGWREEIQARSQWARIEDSVCPKRTCLIEGCADHLTWVFLDRFTWRAPQAGEWLPVNDRVTRGKLGEAGREYFLRRANELFHSVCPLRGSLTRKVWEDLGAYRGLHEAALAALAALAERDDAHSPRVVQRTAYTTALAWARQVS